MDRCALCPHAYNIVPSDGPDNARIMAIGEAPGQNEDRVLRPFVGQAGMEYNDNYLPLAGLHRSEIRQCNVVSCRPDQNKTPSDALARCCADHHLAQEFQNESLEVVLLLGATACNTLCPGVDLESQHGIPFRAKVYGWEGWVVPMYHPAAGLHNTALMIPLLEDFSKLRPWLDGSCWQWPDYDVARTRDYRLARSPRDVRHYFDTYPIEDYFGVDSESHAGVDFSIQVTSKIKTGIMILMTDHQSLGELANYINAAMGFGQSVPVFHNAEADIDLTAKVSGFPIVEYRDTMIEAYELQNLPQKLKSLSYRLLGRKRQSWQQVVGGYSRDALVTWLWQAREIAATEFTQVLPQVSAKTGKPIKPKIIKSRLEALFNRLMTHTSKPLDDSNDKPYDPWKKLKDFDYSASEQIQMSTLSSRRGAYPLLGIANCPLVPVARDYGCSDSDDTLALAYELDRLRKAAEAGWAVQEQDVDTQRV